jgi:hypothetical protein
MRDQESDSCLVPRVKGLDLLVCSALVALLTLTHLAHAATGPSIQLFPTAILEDIKQTGRVAEAMESGLQESIAKLDQQRQLYTSSRCDGAQNDPGCAQLARQMGATYLEMLNVMSERLPDMERAVNSTRTSLEYRLRRELGQKSTPWTLQELLLGSYSDSGDDKQPALRGRSGMRLSDRFQRYYQLVSNSRGNNGSSLAVIASDIYLDMDEAANLIAMTREEINRAQLMEELNQSFGMITPEMEEVVAGVKSILFGEAADELPIAGAPPAQTEEVYRSPLAM